MAVDMAQLAADDAAYNKQAMAQNKAQQNQDGQAKQEPTLNTIGTADRGHVTSSAIDGIVNEVEQWGTAAKRVGQDAVAGTATAVKNTMDFVSSQHPDDPNDPANAPTPLWDHAKSAVMDFRDSVAVKDPNIVDGLAQGAAQLVGPFMAYSKALSGLHGFANTVAAGAVTDVTALAPHDMRTADLIALGRQTDTKIGAVLRTLGPYGLNAYVNFLSDRTNETEAEGRFKNALDGLGANLVVSPLIHAAGIVVKQGTAATRYLAENGVRNTVGDMIADPKVGPSAQEGKIGYHGTPHDFDVNAGFDDSKIGTGEGAQTFGYGHYLAESPDVAGTYQTRLVARDGRSKPLGLAQQAVSDSGGDVQKAYKKLGFSIENEGEVTKRVDLQRAQQLVKSGNFTRGKGSLVTAEVNDEDVASMLDHDKPLSEQPELLKKIPKGDQAVFQQVLDDHGQDMELGELTGNEFRQLVERAHNEGYLQGKDPLDSNDRRLASQYLEKQGVPGIKYLDGKSRGEGEGTRNLVVFSGKRIKVVGKK